MTTTDLARQEKALNLLQPTKLAELTGFSDAQINLIRQTAAVGASIVEVAWYLYNAKRLGLEPTLKQIYLIKYNAHKPAEIVVGIDGYRKQAADTREYAGSDEPQYEYDQVGQPQGAPSKATVTVWRMVQGQRVPFTAAARWEEFYPGSGPIGEQYRKRPHNQLAIRAESHALRKAFPHQTERLDAHQGLPTEWEQAASTYTIEQQPAPELIEARAAEHKRIFGSEDDGTAFADLPPRPAAPPPPVQQGDPPPAAEKDDSAAAPARSGEPATEAELAENAALVEDARSLNVKGLGPLTAKPGWPGDKTRDATAELRARIRSRNNELDGENARASGQAEF